MNKKSAGPIRVLLVDDNPMDAVLVRENLAKHGEFEIEHAETLAEGLSLAAANRAHVAVCDLTLPDAHGLDIVRKFLERDVPVVVMTGWPDPTLADLACELGVHCYLIKGMQDFEALAECCRGAAGRGPPDDPVESTDGRRKT